MECPAKMYKPLRAFSFQLLQKDLESSIFAVYDKRELFRRAFPKRLPAQSRNPLRSILDPSLFQTELSETRYLCHCHAV